MDIDPRCEVNYHKHIKLHQHQQDAVDRSPDKWGLWFKMRVGKTPTAIKLADTRCKTALVICPKYLVFNWNIEIEKCSSGECQFTVISKETFRRDHKLLQSFDAIIIDECHLGFANYKSKLFKALEYYKKLHNPRFIWLLTGTPYTSNEWATYSYGKILGKDWNWFKWSRYFFEQVKMGRRTIPVFKKKMEPELQKLLRSIGTVIALEDIADVAEDCDVIETFALTKEQKAEIENIIEILPITRYTKQHMSESGIMKGDGYVEDKWFKSEKDERILQLCQENDRIIIVVRYLALIDKYRKILHDGLSDRHIYEISGRIKEGASEVANKIEEDSGKVVVLLQSDTVAGYSLKSMDIMVFASLSYSFVNYDQCRSRIKAMEKSTPCTYIHLLTEGKSIDKAVYDCIQHKRDFDAELYGVNK